MAVVVMAATVAISHLEGRISMVAQQRPEAGKVRLATMSWSGLWDMGCGIEWVNLGVAVLLSSFTLPRRIASILLPWLVQSRLVIKT